RVRPGLVRAPRGGGATLRTRSANCPRSRAGFRRGRRRRSRRARARTRDHPVMLRVDLSVPRRVMAVGAHPDDIEFGCGATLAKWADAGAEVHLCICTDGSKGTWDSDADTAALVAKRE